jgi:hypothetical protein
VEPQSAEDLLDSLRTLALRGDPALEDRFGQLIARFDPARIAEALEGRITDLDGPFGEIVLRIVEAFGTPELFAELASALDRRPDLAPERQWEALSLLAGAGVLDDRPELGARLDELEELIGQAEGVLNTLADQIEHDPDGIWLALEGLGAMEVTDRVAVLDDLARDRPGPGVAELLRLSAHSGDPASRRAALEALRSLPADLSRPAWSRLVREHEDPEVTSIAGRELAIQPPPAEPSPPVRVGPRLTSSLVTSLDAKGVGWIVLGAWDGGETATAAFECDVLRGVRDVIGQVGREAGESLRAEILAEPGRDAVEQAHELALGLLSGTWLLAGRDTTPSLRYWLERTAGPAFRARPFVEHVPAVDDDRAATAGLEAAAARLVLDACPWWVDDSELTIDLAEERLLRGEPAPPDPRRDSGIYRFLFERRIKGQLELHRRMLLWMGAFWQAAGEDELVRAARLLALQLMDAQNAVPGHPFIAMLTTRSLQRAHDDLARGIDPRDPLSRADRSPGG